MDCPKVLEPCGTARSFGGQTLGKLSPTACGPVHPGARTGYQKAKVSLGGEKSDQLLQQTAWSKAASRPHTFAVWKVLPIEEGADAPPCAAPVPSPFQRGISFCRGFGASDTVRVGAVASAAAASSGHGDWLPFTLNFKLLQPAFPSRRPSPLRRPLSYLVMQHLVARFPGALLPRSLFPYLGGKRNRETERGPKLSSGRLPAPAALSGREMAARAGASKPGRPGWG